MAALPVFKLGVLLIKQLTKPVAKWIKNEAGSHPVLKRACVSVGQLSHRLQTRMDIRMLGADVKQVKPLNDSMAVTRGAEFLSEAFIFSVGAGLLVLEYTRSSREKAESSAAAKERSELKQKLIKARFAALEQETTALRAHLTALERHMPMSRDEAQAVASAEAAAAVARERTEGIRKEAQGVAPVLAGEEYTPRPVAPEAVAPLPPSAVSRFSGLFSHRPTHVQDGSMVGTADLDAQAAAAAAEVDRLKGQYEELKRQAAVAAAEPSGWANVFGLGIDLTSLTGVFYTPMDVAADAVQEAVHEGVAGAVVDAVANDR